jgi:signal transduction histidine kinase/ActR/RegA family two-component response regulator
LASPSPAPGTRVIRALTRLALSLAIFLVLMAPGMFLGFSIQEVRGTMKAEAGSQVRAIQQIIQDRPELWEYEVLRLREILNLPSTGWALEERALCTKAGRALLRTTYRAPWPTLDQSSPIYDSGQHVGNIESRRSLRHLGPSTLGITLAAALLAAIFFFGVRFMPIRTLGLAITDLEAGRRLLATTMGAIPDGVLASDAEGRVIFLNPAAAAFLGQGARSAEGKPVQEVYPVSPCLAPPLPPNTRRVHFQMDGQALHTLEERLSRMLSEQGEPAGEVRIFRDITDQLRLESELLRIRQIESLGVLAGGIAHDFNNFLAAIMGYLSLAKDSLPVKSKTFQRLERAEQATERAKALSMKLLTFAKGGQPNRRILNLGELIREASEFAIHGTGVRIDFVLAPNLPNAEVDDGLISQVFHNLVINAVQAMDGSGVVTVHLERVDVVKGPAHPVDSGSYLKVTLMDSGPGIPVDILPRIFEPYFSTKETGRGLGLASCFNIIRAHGGFITAESPQGGGGVFTLLLPATNQPIPAEATKPHASARRHRGRILVMDDVPSLQDIAAAMLGNLGFEATICADGASAVEVYQSAIHGGSSFRAVILDLTVPGGMGGLAAAAKLLAVDPKARLIVSSGYSDDPVMARPRQYGFAGVLQKPYRLKELNQVLESVLGENPV